MMRIKEDSKGLKTTLNSITTRYQVLTEQTKNCEDDFEKELKETVDEIKKEIYIKSNQMEASLNNINEDCKKSDKMTMILESLIYEYKNSLEY